jgi:predicted acetyltransferase
VSVHVSKPNSSLSAPFLAMLDDYDAHDPENGEFYAAARLDFDAYVRSLLDEERGVDLPEGYVPCAHRWLLDAAEDIVGVARVRHSIDTPFLAKEAGHIGYDVPPAHRGQRYGIASLRAALAEAQRLGLGRVLLCCDADNPASWRTIEACGGVLERELHSQHFECLVRRYWIETREADVDGALA